MHKLPSRLRSQSAHWKALRLQKAFSASEMPTVACEQRSIPAFECRRKPEGCQSVNDQPACIPVAFRNGFSNCEAERHDLAPAAVDSAFEVKIVPVAFAAKGSATGIETVIGDRTA